MADPRGDQIQAGGLTPSRRTSITWDIGETVLTEPVFWMRREGHQLHPKSTTNVLRLQSGVWILKPTNADFSVVHETTAGQAHAMRLSEFDATSVVKEITYQRKLSELNGVAPSADVATAGDYYFTKRIAAGATWNNQIVTALPKPTAPTEHYPMDRVMWGPKVGTHDANTGYLLKFIVPGAAMQNADGLLNFYFGGPVIGDSSAPRKGFGQFCLALSGDGQARLWERIDAAWTQVGAWRYAAPQQLNAAAVVLRIIPHYPRYIEFSSLAYEAPANLIGVLTQTAVFAIQAMNGERPQTYTHEIDNRPAPYNPGQHGRGHRYAITGPGSVGFDVRRDLRMMWQLSRLVYPASGTIVDGAFTLPWEVGSAHILRAQAMGYDHYDGGETRRTSMAIVPRKTDGSALATASESYSYQGQTIAATGWVPPGGLNKLEAVITLTNEETGTRTHTPCFTGYQMKRNGHPQAIANGTKTGGRWDRITVTGPGVSPEHETAGLLIHDEKNELTVLRTRGDVPVRIETTFDAADQTKKSVLFEGYAGRVEAYRKGKRGRVYPQAEWRDLECQLVGKWARLQDRFMHIRYNFADDRDSPSGAGSATEILPWKITDAIWLLLNHMGHTPSQIDVPDDPIRFFSNPGAHSSDIYSPAPGTPILEFALMIARDFLNAFLIWDANAGSAGMWRLQRPPTGTETPLWNFVTTGAAAGKLQHRRESYGANTSPILGPEPFFTWPVKPEGNVLTVTGGADKKTGKKLARTLVNRASYQAPGFPAADPNNLDYLGRVAPIEYVDPTLVSRAAVDFVARRVYDLACRGRKFGMFTAELVLVAPADSVYTTRTHRPLRIGDLVTIDGEVWMIHTCNPEYRKDHLQRALYEVEFFRPGTTFR